MRDEEDNINVIAEGEHSLKKSAIALTQLLLEIVHIYVCVQLLGRFF